MTTSRLTRTIAASLFTLTTIGGVGVAVAAPASAAGTARRAPTATVGDIRFGVQPINNPSAGHSYVDLTYTNRTDHNVQIRGFSGISVVADGNGTQVGRPTHWLTNQHPATVVLKPGQTTTELVTIADAGDFGPTRHHTVKADGFRVYLPGSRAAAFVPYHLTASTRNVSQLQANPVGTRH